MNSTENSTEQPIVSTYRLTANNGRHVRIATMVTFPSGRVVRFMERMSKREAIRQARTVSGTTR